MAKRFLKIKSNISMRYLFFVLGGIWNEGVCPHWSSQGSGDNLIAKNDIQRKKKLKWVICGLLA